MAVPAVSIIIPTHNRQSMLLEAMDSVSAQTVRDWELIVVDDGSTEPVGEAAAGHPARPRVLRHDRRLGPAAARNAGIRAARGEFVAFLDSDDLWLPTKLERFLGALEGDRETGIYYGPMRPISADRAPVPGRTKPCHRGRITEPLFQSSFVHVPTVVCRRQLLERAGGFDERLPVCEDYDLWLRLSVDEPFGLIEEPLALRRLHANRLSKAHMSRNLAVKAGVLRRFHDAPAAQRLLRPESARPRLARVCFVAARAALSNGEHLQALHFCRACRAIGGPAWRCILLSLGARVRALISHKGAARNVADVLGTGAPAERPVQPG